MDVELLHEAIAAVVPTLKSVSVRNPANKATWIMTFEEGTTPAQIAAAQAVIDGWVDSYESRIRAEALRRIYAAVPAELLVFLIGFHLANILTAGDKAALADLANWIKSMRVAANALITANDPDYALNSKWPTVPASVTTLIAAYKV